MQINTLLAPSRKERQLQLDVRMSTVCEASLHNSFLFTPVLLASLMCAAT